MHPLAVHTLAEEAALGDGDIPQAVGGEDFALAFFDEAHKTAGANLASGFSIGLDDEALPAQKRLFMTATEKLFRPRLIERAEESGVELLSMDQESKYGPIFHSLSFRKAIEREITLYLPGLPVSLKKFFASFHADSTASPPPVVKNTRLRSPGA